MALPRLLVACLALVVAVAAQSATPSNYTYVLPAQKNETVVLALNEGGNVWQPYWLNPLSTGALDILPNSASSTTGLDGNMYLVGPGTTTDLTEDDIAVISCDPNVYTQGLLTLQSVVANAISANVTAILFYALGSTTCNITGNYGDYEAVYSMILTENSQDLYAHLQSATIQHSALLSALILTRTAFLNVYYSGGDGPAPGTAVAMIILYSITGLITALFLSIIITGAIRAHRHPERYGRRDFLGRPTQSRARGLARAILETIPIVKFGDQPTPKEGGIELNGASETTQHTSNSTTAAHATASDQPSSESEHTHPAIITTSATTHDQSPKNETTTTTTTTPSSPISPTDDDTTLGCSICTDDFEKGQDIRVLPCSHKFHPACVDPWLLDVSSTCPLCRVDLRTNSVSDPDADAAAGTSTSAPLAPPLRGLAASRRARLGEFFANLRGVQNATPAERIAALRSLRMERSRAGSVDMEDEEAGQAAEVDAVAGRTRQTGRGQRFGRGGLRGLLGGVSSGAVLSGR